MSLSSRFIGRGLNSEASFLTILSGRDPDLVRGLRGEENLSLGSSRALSSIELSRVSMLGSFLAGSRP